MENAARQKFGPDLGKMGANKWYHFFFSFFFDILNIFWERRFLGKNAENRGIFYHICQKKSSHIYNLFPPSCQGRNVDTLVFDGTKQSSSFSQIFPLSLSVKKVSPGINAFLTYMYGRFKFCHQKWNALKGDPSSCDVTETPIILLTCVQGHSTTYYQL